MLPVPSAGIGPVEFPTLPPRASGPNPSGPFAFGKLYDSLVTHQDAGRALPSPMEVPPIIAPAASLAEPFQPSPEFPGAVDPDGRVAPQAATDPIGTLLKPLQQGLGQVNALHHQAKSLSEEAAVGGDVDLHDVMIASEKAGIATQLTLQIRNKMVEAYQEVMRMQV